MRKLHSVTLLVRRVAIYPFLKDRDIFYYRTLLIWAPIAALVACCTPLTSLIVARFGERPKPADFPAKNKNTLDIPEQ